LSTCPTDSQLAMYATGRVDEDTASAIDHHLEDCPLCVEIVDGLHPDSLVLALRGVPTRQSGAGVIPSNSASVENIPKPHRLGSSREATFETIRDYQLVERIGSGGMGDVYLALHVRLNRYVALKFVRHDRRHKPEAISRFEQEMRSVGRLEHENIVRALDAGEENGNYYLAMEYVDGTDLRKLKQHFGRLEVGTVCELIRQTGVGLQHAHDHGLIHRDIKPANLMLTARGCVKVLDLGLALLQHPLQESNALTQSAQILGTIAYMSPEQSVGTADERSDVFSLGVSMFELLAGHLPVQTETFNSGPPSIRSLRTDTPHEVEILLNGMLERNPNDRPSMNVIIASLTQWATSENLETLVRRYRGDSAEQSLNYAIPTQAPSQFTTDRAPTVPPALPPLPPPIVEPKPDPQQQEHPSSFWGPKYVTAAVIPPFALLLLAAMFWAFLEGDRDAVVIVETPPSFMQHAKDENETSDVLVAIDIESQEKFSLQPGLNRIPPGEYSIEHPNWIVSSGLLKVTAGSEERLPLTLANGNLVVDTKSSYVSELLAANSNSPPYLVAVQNTTGKHYPLVVGENQIPVGDYALLPKAWELGLLSSNAVKIAVGSEEHVEVTVDLKTPPQYPSVPSAFGASVTYTGAIWRLGMSPSASIGYKLKLSMMEPEDENRWLKVEVTSTDFDYKETGYLLVNAEDYARNQELKVVDGWLKAESSKIRNRLSPYEINQLVVRYDPDSPVKDPLNDLAAQYGLKLPGDRASVQEAMVLLFEADMLAPSPFAQTVREKLPKNVTYEQREYNKSASPLRCFVVKAMERIRVSDVMRSKSYGSTLLNWIPNLGENELEFGYELWLNKDTPFRFVKVSMNSPLLTGGLSLENRVTSGDPDVERLPPVEELRECIDRLQAAPRAFDPSWAVASLSHAKAGDRIRFDVQFDEQKPIEVSVGLIDIDSAPEKVWMEVAIEDSIVRNGRENLVRQKALICVDSSAETGIVKNIEGWIHRDGHTMPFPKISESGTELKNDFRLLSEREPSDLRFSVIDAVELLFDTSHDASNLKNLRKDWRASLLQPPPFSGGQNKPDPGGEGDLPVDIFSASTNACAVEIERCSDIPFGLYRFVFKKSELGQSSNLSISATGYRREAEPTPDLLVGWQEAAAKTATLLLRQQTKFES
jgi:serine/threonine protein kinase